MMAVTPDSELLGQFLERRSQEAFARVVERYAGIVYSAALRQTRNREHAEDVSQRVFITLARKAARVRHTPVLSAWLLTCTRYEALNVMKSEARRIRHEQTAAASRPDVVPGAGGPGCAADDERWGDVAPLLDEAVETLGRGRREAVLLRYFEGKSVREVAERLGITEDAAKQRLSRGVEQLRRFFGARGVAVPATAIGVMLASHAAEAAPAGVAGAISVAAVAHAGSAGASGAVTAVGWKGWLTVMATAAKVKGIAVVVGALAVLGVGTAVMVDRNGAAGRGPRLVGPGVARVSLSSTSGAPVGVAYRGLVRSPDGRPVARAEVLLATDLVMARVHYQGRQMSPTARTAADGRFEFAPQAGVRTIVVRCTAGYAEVSARGFANGGDIVIQPWGRIEGVATIEGRPLVHRTVRLSTAIEGVPDFGAMIDRGATANTDGEGRFAFPRVTPGRHWVGPQEQPTQPPGVPVGEASVRADVGPGATVRLVLGGAGGRSVVGRVERAEGLVLRGLLTPVRVGGASTRRSDAEAAGGEPEVPYAFRVATGPDGAFRAADVPPGQYRLRLDAHVQPEASVIAEHAASAVGLFTVPPAGDPNGSQREVVVGPFTATLDVRLKVGDPAPAFTATMADGKKVTLANYAGRYLVLRISRAGGTPSWVDRPSDYDALLDRFGRDNLPFLELNVRAAQSGAVRADAGSVAASSWPNAVAVTIGADALPREYASAPVPLFLVDPQGRIAAKWLSARSLWTMLERVLPARGMPPAEGVAEVITAHREVRQADAAYAFDHVPPITLEDLGRGAAVTVVDGAVGSSSGGVGVLRDGVGGKSVDDPAGAFFFDTDRLEGRLRIDLGQSTPLDRVTTYSWHTSTRCPQVYRLYGADGASSDFDPAPKVGVDPARRGWTPIATVDTRRANDPGARAGGQDAVSITGIVGEYRYLLLVTFVTETDDPFGHTFFNEIDVVGRGSQP